MLFTSFEFALFFLVILALNWVLRRQAGLYKVFLLAANAVFYASLNLKFLPLLLMIGLINWFFALSFTLTTRTWARKALMFLDLTLNLGLLAFFKYFEFFAGSLESLLLDISPNLRLPMIEIAYPVGLSFFTFQGLSYAIDVYRRPEEVARNPVDVLLFVSFFPTVLSGPIMRAKEFLPQLTSPTYDSRSFLAGFGYILSGLFKKIVIASYLSENIVRQVFQVPADFSSLSVLTAVWAYSIQIFCDFSGYSDLALGLALLLGYKIPQNFFSPYTTTNLIDFWRRWHVSLSNWLRDYLYISLGGNQKGRVRKYLHLMITMILGGLWHGAHSRFLLWGALHGLLLTLTHIWRDLRPRPVRTAERTDISSELTAQPTVAWSTAARMTGKFLGWLITFNLVSFLWVFFRAEDTTRAFEIFRAVFNLNQPGAGFESLVIPAILAGLLIQLFGARVFEFYLKVQERLPLPLQAAAIALLILIILRLGPEGMLPFIYFQF